MIQDKWTNLRYTPVHTEEQQSTWRKNRWIHHTAYRQNR